MLDSMPHRHPFAPDNNGTTTTTTAQPDTDYTSIINNPFITLLIVVGLMVCLMIVAIVVKHYCLHLCHRSPEGNEETGRNDRSGGDEAPLSRNAESFGSRSPPPLYRESSENQGCLPTSTLDATVGDQPASSFHETVGDQSRFPTRLPPSYQNTEEERNEGIGGVATVMHGGVPIAPINRRHRKLVDEMDAERSTTSTVAEVVTPSTSFQLVPVSNEDLGAVGPAQLPSSSRSRSPPPSYIESERQRSDDVRRAGDWLFVGNPPHEEPRDAAGENLVGGIPENTTDDQCIQYETSL